MAQQQKSKIPLAIGLTAAAGVGYYLFQAGGNPTVAEKKFEADVSKASARVKGDIPARRKEAEKKAEAWGAEAGQKIDAAKDQARSGLSKTEKSISDYRMEVGKEAMAKIDKFDSAVEEKAAQAKSGIAGWFGGKQSTRSG